jgi:hypothetical protein
MADALFGYDNRILTGTLTAGSEATGLPVTNLTSPQGATSNAWQTAGGVLTGAAGAWMLIDAGASVTWRVFVLTRTNLTTAAQVRWRVGTTVSSNVPGSLTYDSGTVSAGVRAGIGQSVIVAPSQISGRYVRLDLTDSANPDTVISIGLCYAGPVYQPAFNVGWGTSFSIDPQVEEVTTRSGQEYPVLRWERRRWDLALDNIATAEVWPSLLEWYRVGRRGDNVLYINDPASADLASEAIFGRCGSLADITYPIESTDYRAWRARITERL